MTRRDQKVIRSCAALLENRDFRLFLDWMEDSLVQEMDVFVGAVGEDIFRAQGRVAVLRQLLASVVESPKLLDLKLGSSSL